MTIEQQSARRWSDLSLEAIEKSIKLFPSSERSNIEKLSDGLDNKSGTPTDTIGAKNAASVKPSMLDKLRLRQKISRAYIHTSN